MKSALLLCALALFAGQAAAHCVYKLDATETLSEIAKAYKIGLEELIAANTQLENPDQVLEGQVIYVPCDPETRGDNLLDLLEHRNETALLVQAIYAAGLDKTLAEIDDDATLFGPTDEAFAALLEKLGTNLTNLAADPKTLGDILKFHLVLGDSIRAKDIKEGETTLETALGQKITVVKGADGVSIKLPNGDVAKVVKADLRGDDAIVHLIDLVLTPPQEAPAAAAPAAAPEAAPCTYKIGSGDTLAALAIRYGTSVDAILKLNPSITDPNKIVAGSTLKLKEC